MLTVTRVSRGHTKPMRSIPESTNGPFCGPIRFDAGYKAPGASSSTWPRPQAAPTAPLRLVFERQVIDVAVAQRACHGLPRAHGRRAAVGRAALLYQQPARAHGGRVGRA